MQEGANREVGSFALFFPDNRIQPDFVAASRTYITGLPDCFCFKSESLYCCVLRANFSFYPHFICSQNVTAECINPIYQFL